MDEPNKPLGELLQDLVSDDEASRHAASRRVMPLREDSQAAVRAAVNEPDFPFAPWYASLHSLNTELSQEAARLRDRDRDRKKRVEERIRAKYEQAVAEEQKPFRALRDADEWVEPGPVSRKMWELLRGVFAADTRESIRATRLTQQAMSIGFVFRALRTEVLRDPGRIRDILRDPRKRYQAEETLAELGAEATDLFADEVLERVLTEGFRSSSTHKAIKAMLAGDDRRIGRVAGWLSPDDPVRRANGARILRMFGEDVARVAPNTILLLFAMAETGSVGDGNGERIAALYALGSVTRGTDAAVDFLLAQSESDNIWVKRAALVSLGTIVRQPERVVPRMIRALRDYEEPDPDSLYNGRHEVVTDTLRTFGDAAGAAVPALIERIEEGMTQTKNADGTVAQTREIDPGVVSALVTIGEPAIAALPTLEQYAGEPHSEEHQAASYTPLKRAIATLRKLAAAREQASK